jgi:alpha-tubulin suppressor-like RCC1 family protein
MTRRVLTVLFLVFAVSLWVATMHAQDETITNADQLVTVVDQYGLCYPLVSPTESPLSWQALGVFWADFSQLTNAIGDVRNFEGETQYGITVWRLRLTRTVDGTVFSYPVANTNLLQLAALGDDGFSNHYQHVLWEWTILAAVRNYESYEDLLADGYTFLDPKRLVLDIWLADINDCSIYQDNSAGRTFTMMSEEDSDDDLTPGFSIDGDPCAITNLLQRFSVTLIQRATNGATSVMWESCPRFRYCVLAADQLSFNTTWLPQTYIWGQTNASLTTWTDTSTTNNDGSTVTQRFYRVQRLLASPMGAGTFHSLALTADGKLWAWGLNWDPENGGDLGDGLGPLVEPSRPFPGEVAPVTSCTGQTISNAVTMAGDGDDCSMAVDAHGAVWTWGEAEHGELGNGTYGPNQPVPAPITGVSNVVSVSAGSEHTLVLRADGAVFAWGEDAGDYNYGALGVGGGLPLGQTNLPIRSLVPTQTVVVAIAAGCSHSVALDVTGGVWVWGNGAEGELGNGRTTNVSIPIPVTGISNVIAIAAGCDQTIALTADKRVWTWGGNAQGDLGRTGNNLVPGLVTGLSNVVAIAGGESFTLAVTSNGQVYAFGDNTYGQLGTNLSSSSIPIPVAGISNAVLVSAHPSGSHSLAMTVDQGTNRYWAWGWNIVGEVGNGTSDNSVYAPAQLQFCTRCQRCVQLGTNGSFTAQCNGTLYLYFNDEIGLFYDNAGSFTVSVDGVTTNVPAYDSTGYGIGVAVGTVTNGGTYPYSASGFCFHNGNDPKTDADGNLTNGTSGSCSSINITNAICPVAKCFSLVGKIQ